MGALKQRGAEINNCANLGANWNLKDLLWYKGWDKCSIAESHTLVDSHPE
jgi:hypothetical protein